MDKMQLEKKVAKLESMNDQLQAEFQTLDKMLKQLGFEAGIATLKEAASEMLSNKKNKAKDKKSFETEEE